MSHCAAAAIHEKNNGALSAHSEESKRPAQRKGSRGTRFLGAFAVLCFALGVAGTATARADSGRLASPTSFNIPSQPLSTALKALADQAGIQILFEERIVQGHDAPAIKARQTAAQALRALLANTDLEFTAKDQTVAVRKKTPPPLSSNSSSRRAEEGAIGEGEGQGTAGPMRLARAEGEETKATAGSQEKKPASSSEKPGETGIQLTTVVVTATRVKRDGFSAPTPTTVISAEELRQSGHTNLGQALADIPQFHGSELPTTNSGSLMNGGTSSIDMRGLGASRTLVMIDGRRVVQTHAAALNVSLLPFSLIERTEVVTGGASAAWGSDAVAGVVNIILNDDFTGLRVEGQNGMSTHGDGDKYQLSLAAGTPFAAGNGHLLFAAEYVNDKGIAPRTARDGVGACGQVANPTPGAGQPQFLIRCGLKWKDVSDGGVMNVVTGPGAGRVVPGHPLNGLEFLPGGATDPFVRGSLVPPGPFMVGGEGAYHEEFLSLSTPNERANLYGVATYDLGADTQLRFDLLAARTRSEYGLPPTANGGLPGPPFTIMADNAFLPAAVSSQLAPGQRIALSRWSGDFGERINTVDAKTLQATLSLRGSFADTWKWDTYYAQGRTDRSVTLLNTPVSERYFQAVDSVLANNVAGVANGTPICRVRITDPTTACVPVNLFGAGAPSQAALDYFLETANTVSDYRLKAAAASISGEPFSTWAGPLSTAFGLEWREESVGVSVDPVSAEAGFYGLPVLTTMDGKFTVKEFFAETVVPVLNDLPLIQLLEINGAVRRSDYSNFGGATTWKAGITNQVSDSLRLRATRSRDIRAPNMNELFAQGALLLGNNTVSNPFTGNLSDAIRVLTGGNEDLTRELATTNTAGIVYSPQWLERLTLSLDWYAIEIVDAIGTLTTQEIVNACFQGNAAACDRVVFGEEGDILDVRRTTINIGSLKTQGVDFEASYTLPVFTAIPGRIQMRALLAYVDELLIKSGPNAAARDGAGDFAVSGGVPQWRGTFGANYVLNDTKFNASVRYVGGANRDKTRTIDDQRLEAEIYLDIGAEHTFDWRNTGGITVYGNIRNVLDNEPQWAPEVSFHDVIGRYFTLGARVTM